MFCLCRLVFAEFQPFKRMSVGLTKDQLEQFEKDGLLVIDNFLGPDEVTAIRKEQRNRMHSEHNFTVHAFISCIFALLC